MSILPNVPQSLQPACWEDETRMNALLAPLRPRSIDPTAYASKVEFWTDLIGRLCTHCKVYAVSLNMLKNALQWNGKSPACLHTVIQELRNNGTLVDKNSFTSPSETWSGWAMGVFVVSWLYQKVKGDPVQLEDGLFIHLPALKDASQVLVHDMPNEMKGKVWNLETVAQNYLDGNKANAELIVNYLRSNKEVAVMIHSDGTQLVKFKKPNEKMATITELDISIYQLEHNEKLLSNNIEKLEKDSEVALNEAKKYIKLNMKPLAKSSLRKKKVINNYIEKRSMALDNIRSLIHQIDQAESDATILQCYETGITTLKKTFKEAGLTEDRVTDTMDDLEEVLDIHKSIETSLSRSLDSTADADLEDELEKLLTDTPLAPQESSNQEKLLDEAGMAELNTKMASLSFPGLPTPPKHKLNISSPVLPST